MEKKKKYMLIGIIGTLILLIGVSYAYWRLTLTQTGTNQIASSCFSITLTNEENAINLQKAYPILDEEGKELTPYTFTVKNNCDAYASYSVNLELLNTILEENRLSSGFIKVMLDENTPTVLNTNTSVTPTLDNAYEAYELATGYLDKNEEVTYNLRLWMDQDVTIEDNAMNKQLESKITITASYVEHMPTDYEKCVEEYGEDSIQCSIIADADTTGACPTVNDDGTVNITDIEATESLVCSAPDDYGTSYYYRGNVENNWVKFAGFYWRILRMNGDGSIRMIYAGDADVIDALQNKEEVLANGYNDGSTDYTQIGESTYNNFHSDNAYVGYMYGSPNSIKEFSSDKYTIEITRSSALYYADSYIYNEETNSFVLENPTAYTKENSSLDLIGKYTFFNSSANSTNQAIYKVTNVILESEQVMFEYNMLTYATTSKESAQVNINESTIKKVVDEWYKENIEDTGYSNYVSDTLFCNDRSFSPDNSGLGYGISDTTYRSFAENTLKCVQQNDRFTVNDTVNGNGDLTYPVALITSVENILAGSFTPNARYYLFTGNDYWTLSPSGSFDYYTIVWIVNVNGEASYGLGVQNTTGVRPVLNLKPNSLKSGDGSALNPYLVEENV